MRKKALSILLSISMVVPALLAASVPVSAAGWSIGSNDPSWKAVYPANNQNDYLQDQQTGSGSVSQDIVGDASYPSTYMHLTDTEAAFRIRVSNVNGTNPYEFKNFAFVGLDADLNGSVDLFLGAYNPTGNNGRLGIYASSNGYANTGPSTTGISGKPLLGFKPVSDGNYSITPTGDGSSFNGDADYFVSFKFALSDITAALAQKGINNFSASTPFRFMTGTAAQDNAFNQDLNGMDKSGWSSTKTWNELGTFSGVTSANGSVASYTVTFDRNTGDTAASPDFKIVQTGGNTLGALPTAPTKRGMYFQGWNTKADGTGTSVSASTVVGSDLTVYATWSDKQTYTVTFNPNGGNFGGSTAAIVTPTKNGIIGDLMPASPTQTNKYFTGWNTLSNGNGDWFNAFTLVSANTQVYAQWASQANKAALFYNNFTSDGGTLVSTVYSNGNSNNFNGSLPSVTRPGYTLQGWYLNDKTGSGTAVTSITQEGNYYAKWTPASYAITFVANAGSDTVNGMPTSRNVTDGTFGTMPSEPTRAGYQFVEWNRAANGSSEAIYPSTSITANTSVYAIWKASKTVTFDPNGGVGDAQSITAVDGKLNFLPQPPLRDNYSFQGWGTSANATSGVDLRNVSSYSTLYAIWSPVYTMTFDASGGQWSGGATTTDILTAYGSVLYLPDAPERTSYTFGGWNTKADGSGDVFTLSTEVTQPSSRVYAQWVPIASAKYNVTFVTNGGTSVSSQQTNRIETSPSTSRNGYTLEGWYRDSALNESDKVAFPYSVASDQTLYAKWTAVTGSVTLNDNGGSGGSGSVIATFDQAMPSASVPVREGYTFTGYFDQPVGGTSYYDSSMASARNWDRTETSATLYAQWTAIELTAVFNANGGKYSGDVNEEAKKQTYDAKYVLPDVNPVRDGFTFASWNTASDGQGSTVTVNTTVTSAVYHTVYAVWTELGNITITYATDNANYGTVSRGSESLNPATGEALGSTAVAQPGYRFIEWREAGGKTSSEPTLIPQKIEGSYTNGAYTAVFEALTASVMLDANGGSGGTANVTATYDQSMPEASAPSRAGYTFVGYYDQQQGGGLYYDSSMNSARHWDKTEPQVTLYARWSSERAVTGTVADDDNPSKVVLGATIRIVKGNTQYGDTAVTDANGKFTIYNIPAGTYNLIMTIGEKTEIIAITVKANEPVTELGKIIFPLSSASSVLKLKTPDTPPVVINNLHPEAEQYLADENNQGFVKVEMSVARTDENTSDADVKNGIEKIKTQALSKGAYVGMYLDITLDKYKRNTEQESWGASTGKLKETKGLIEIVIPIPADLQGKTSSLYRVYRDHENEPTHTIQETPNAAGEYLKVDPDAQTLTLYVKKFSVYALAYLNPVSYSVEHYVMNTDGSYPASPTRTSSGSGLADSVLTVADLQDSSLTGSGVAYDYGTVGGATSTTAVVKGDGSLTVKLYYARQPQAPIASPSSPAPSSIPAGPSVTAYEVTFDGAGGTPASVKQSVASGSLLTEPKPPVRAGYVFDGWRKADGSAWNFGSDRVYAAVTLSATWKVAAQVQPPPLDKVNHLAYMQGYPDRTFRADRNMTRAEVIAMFSRLLTEKMNMDQTYASTFRDVRGSNWYANAVGYMQQAGVVTGYADGTFGPEEPITRAEFAAIASRFDKLDAGDASVFKDVRASYWAGDYIASGVAKGWIKGYPDGTFRPEDYVTRAEAVTLVNRMTERNPDRSYIDGNGSLIESYKDLKKSYWAYYDIMEAVTRHDYVKGSNGETWTAPTAK